MTNTLVRDSKDTLAKLMASENISVVHRKVSTAYFDLENRVLCCPVLKDDISPELYDLFMGHEVGHALNTPYEGLHTTVTENPSLKGYLNVIEDVRIERDIKNRYQGLRRSFHTAYNELMEMDFFGIKKHDLDKIALIDKINLITKCGHRVLINLSDEEQKFLDMAESCETWEDVVACATAIFKFSKENETRTQEDENITYEKMLDNLGSNENDMGDGDDGDSQTGDGDDGDGEEKDSPEKSLENDETDEDDSDEIFSSNEGGQNARESITDHFSHKNENTFIDETACVRTQIDLKPIFDNNNNFEKNVVGFQQILEDWNRYKTDRPDVKNNDVLIRTSTRILTDRNKKMVSHMVREFEMRQTATRFSKASISKTGKLDTNRLAKYKIVEDIFQRTTMVPDGKNHGVVVMLDWSSSISRSVSDLIEQALILVNFCRKTNIPYRIFLFSDYNDRWCTGRGSLMELFSDKMTNRQHNEMLYNVSCLWYSYFVRKLMSRGHFSKNLTEYNKMFGTNHSTGDGYVYLDYHLYPSNYNLGGTPLDENLVALRTYLPKFRKMYGLEKCILTVLTDGYSHPCELLDPSREERDEIEAQLSGTRYSWREKVKRFMVDPFSRKVYELGTLSYRGSDFRTTQNLLNWLSLETGFTVTGYFCVNDKRDFHSLSHHAALNLSDTDWREVGKTGKVFDAHGYNKLFVCKTSSLSVHGEDFLDEDLKEASVRKISTAFLKNQKNKSSSRFLANEFIKEIA